MTVLGHLRVRRADPDAEPLLSEALELAMRTGEIQRVAPVRMARAEYAWLKGDLQQVISEARTVREMTSEHDEPWLRGELAFWIWRAGGVVENHEGVAAPYALQMSGDWRAAAEAWRETGCPYNRQMEVLRLLADGLRNAEIANALFISPKTVDHHVSAILSNLAPRHALKPFRSFCNQVSSREIRNCNQKAEGRKQKAESRRQKAESRRQRGF